MNPNQLTSWIEQGVAQLHGWDATTDSVYAFAGMVIVYVFILMSRDKARGD